MQMILMVVKIVKEIVMLWDQRMAPEPEISGFSGIAV